MSMFDKIKQLKDLREQAQHLKEILSTEFATGEARGVRVTLNGNQEVTAVDIPEELLSAGKKVECESAMREAANEAIKSIQRIIARKMQESGGFPGLT